MLPAEVKANLSSGKFILAEHLKGKSPIWKHFWLVVNADNNDATGFVKCKGCNELMRLLLMAL